MTQAPLASIERELVPKDEYLRQVILVMEQYTEFISLPQELQYEVMQQCSSRYLSRLGISNITLHH
jgi:hypothetical protein